MVRAIPFLTELAHKFMKEIQNCPKQKQTSQAIYYNAMMGSVRAATVAVESNNYYIIWESVCSLRYPGCNVHAPYLPSVASPALQYFSTLSHRRHDFRKQVIENKTYISIISTCLSETFLILGRIERDDKKHILTFILFVSDFNATRIFWTDFEEFPGTKFHKNPFSGSRVVPYGQTDRHDEANNSRFSRVY